ncbi:MAG: entericidin A/B family lipoprotein [Alphaproteobacteria bacterium]
MKNIMLITSFMIIGGALSGCSGTLDGAGRDIEKAGQKIQKTF